jgi:hypothetical protein
MNSELLSAIKDQLLALGLKIQADSGGLSRHPDQAHLPEWRGADTVVTSDFTYENQGFGSELIVRTFHAKQLSWMIFELRDIFSGFLDAHNKYGFYEALASSALKHLAAHQPESDDHRPLLQAVVAQGLKWLKVIRRYDEIPATPIISISSTDAEGRQYRQYIEPEDND